MELHVTDHNSLQRSQAEIRAFIKDMQTGNDALRQKLAASKRKLNDAKEQVSGRSAPALASGAKPGANHRYGQPKARDSVTTTDVLVQHKPDLAKEQSVSIPVSFIEEHHLYQ